MTEAEWMDWKDPYELIGCITKQYQFSERKIRLFAVACCRRILHLLPQPETEWGCLKAFESAERRAEDPAAEAAQDPEHLIAALSESSGGFAAAAVSAARTDAKAGSSYAAHAVYAASALTGTGYADLPAMVWSVAADAGAAIDAITDDTEQQFQAEIVRDIFGNPFRPPALDPSWLTAKMMALARAIYDEQAFGRMPELADALSQADCRSDDLLGHCRQPGPHVRGCWLVDLLLRRR